MTCKLNSTPLLLASALTLVPVHALATQKILSISETVHAQETDRFGNRVTHLDFEGSCERLRIESRFDLETAAPEPFAGSSPPPLPWARGPDDPMAQYRSGEAQEPPVREFASVLASESGWKVLLFLDRLMECAPAGGQDQAAVLTVSRAC